jgi:UDP-glucose 4-epimerase
MTSNSTNGNRILVTGGAGFIGSSLVDAILKSKKYELLIVLDHNLDKGKRKQIAENAFPDSSHPAYSNIRFVETDMLDMSSVKKAVNDCDFVFHLAGNPDVRKGIIDTRLDFSHNLISTYNLLEAMRMSDHCRKLVFTSTSAVYGDSDLIPVSERCCTVTPLSLYAASKLASESLISGYCHIFDIRAIVLRLANVVGPTSTHGVIYDFVTRLSSLDTRLSGSGEYYLDVLGDGNQAKSYLFIDDCINCLLTCLKIIEKIPSHFEIFNAGPKDILSVSDIAKIVIDSVRLNDMVIARPDGGVEGGRGWKGDVKQILLDSSKLGALGWNPKYNSREAVFQTVREMGKNNHRLSKKIYRNAKKQRQK